MHIKLNYLHLLSHKYSKQEPQIIHHCHPKDKPFFPSSPSNKIALISALSLFPHPLPLSSIASRVALTVHGGSENGKRSYEAPFSVSRKHSHSHSMAHTKPQPSHLSRQSSRVELGHGSRYWAALALELLLMMILRRGCVRSFSAPVELCSRYCHSQLNQFASSSSKQTTLTHLPIYIHL